MSHSDAGPSSFATIIACAAYYRLNKGLPSVSTVYNRNGTLAHTVAEEYLLQGTKPHNLIGQVRDVEGYEHTITKEMADACVMYVESVWGSIEPGDFLRVEEEVAIGWIDPIIGHGTVDAACINMPQKKVCIWDLKYGTSPVKVEGNAQFMLYALGVLGEHNERNIETVQLGAVQPRVKRKRKVTTHEMPVEELYAWVDDVARPACKRALGLNTEPTKCGGCYFCKAKNNTCPLYPKWAPKKTQYVAVGMQ